jgi:two-component system response regulator FlrC
VLATSNRDLEAEVKAGRFREDLYYRLNVFPLNIPPLRERPNDIVPLANWLLHRGAQAVRGKSFTLSASATACLTSHTWRGNIRELENVIQRAMILAPGTAIEAEHLCLPRTAVHREMPASAVVGAQSQASSGAGGPTDLKSLERAHILETLAAVNGVRKAAAERLGMSERTLRYKLQQYRIEDAGRGGNNVPPPGSGHAEKGVRNK